MTPSLKRPRLVGQFIRQQREKLGISQRSLGLLFEPQVTTQFISNVERGVTPLPPAHVPTLAKALSVNESELLKLLEKEFASKLNGRIGRTVEENNMAENEKADSLPTLMVDPADISFMRTFYAAYRLANLQAREALEHACESILKS